MNQPVQPIPSDCAHLKLGQVLYRLNTAASGDVGDTHVLVTVVVAVLEPFWPLFCPKGEGVRGYTFCTLHEELSHVLTRGRFDDELYFASAGALLQYVNGCNSIQLSDADLDVLIAFHETQIIHAPVRHSMVLLHAGDDSDKAAGFSFSVGELQENMSESCSVGKPWMSRDGKESVIKKAFLSISREADSLDTDVSVVTEAEDQELQITFGQILRAYFG